MAQKKFSYTGLGRPRTRNSKLSYGGYGLTKEEDKQLLQKLQRQSEPNAKKLVRELLRNWLAI